MTKDAIRVMVVDDDPDQLDMVARVLKRRGFVLPEDVKSIGLDVLRHRVIPTYEAEAEGVTGEDVVTRLFDHVPIP